jgi:hypothetical protein
MIMAKRDLSRLLIMAEFARTSEAFHAAHPGSPGQQHSERNPWPKTKDVNNK